MRLPSLLAVILGLAILVGMLGCGASTPQSRSSRSEYGDSRRPSIGGGYGDMSGARAASEATATDVDYFGWKAYKLTNGLVTVVAVPDAGGRILEYKLGSHPFLWVNKAALSRSDDAPAPNEKRKWRNFGGYKVWPAPQDQWGGPPDPPGSELDSGRWEGRLVNRSGETVSVEMTSPQDLTVTGLQITRRITLHAGSTRLHVKETFKNISKREVTWSIWGVTQVPGSLQPRAKFSREARVFFPLKEDSQHKDGFFYIEGKDTRQWKKIADGKILETSYAGKAGKIGADSDAGWIAYVDDLHDFTFVKRFKVTPKAKYPDNSSTVQVYTSGGEYSYMEIEVLSPLKRLSPDQEFSFETDWMCARVGGPIIKTTDVGAIRVHPTAAKKGKQTIVKGELGVFAPGELAIEFLDKDGKKLGRSKPVKVTPTAPATIRITTDPPAGAATAMVVLTDKDGGEAGNIAQVPLLTALAKTKTRPAGG